jgi:hypothetical protein
MRQRAAHGFELMKASELRVEASLTLTQRIGIVARGCKRSAARKNSIKFASNA